MPQYCASIPNSNENNCIIDFEEYLLNKYGELTKGIIIKKYELFKNSSLKSVSDYIQNNLEVNDLKRFVKKNTMY